MNIASTLHNTLHTGTKKLLGAALLGAALLFAPGLQSAAHARVFFSVGIAPPAIPVYDQPPCPGDGYIWTPGYWAWTDDGYQWVDGAWVAAPYAGALWTPGYWGFNNGAYLWNAGYWGTEVGYYGGINYGFGYFGTGFYGGYWGGDRFFYNRAYNHFDRGFRGEFYDHREGGFDGRPGGEGFARNDGGFHGDRGSFAGGHDGRDFHNDHQQAFAGNRQDGGNFNERQNNFNGQQNNARRAFQGNQPQQIPSRQPAQTFQDNRGGFQNPVDRQQPQQGFGGFQNPGATRAAYNPQAYRPAPAQDFGGNRGGFQGNAVRSNNTLTAGNFGGGRSFNPAPAPQGGGFHGGGFQGGGFHGGRR